MAWKASQTSAQDPTGTCTDVTRVVVLCAHVLSSRRAHWTAGRSTNESHSLLEKKKKCLASKQIQVFNTFLITFGKISLKTHFMQMIGFKKIN